MSPDWQISAGELFDLMLPVSFALTALCSAWVLASARRRGLSAPVVTLWTLGTLFFPLIILPLYLIARFLGHRRENQSNIKRDEEDASIIARAAREKSAPVVWRRMLPVAYLFVMLSLGALHFYMDYRSVDAHLARANQARVRGQQERIIEEYRAALRLEENAHTHNLLGRELLDARRFEEALAEFRAAERMNEADDELPFNIAETLYRMERDREAAPEYERFIAGPLCNQPPPDVRCDAARLRLEEIATKQSR